MRHSDAPSVPTAPHVETNTGNHSETGTTLSTLNLTKQPTQTASPLRWYQCTAAGTWRAACALVFIVFCMVSVKAQMEQDSDPSPDDFLNIDKEAVLDKQSLAKFFQYPDSAKKAGLQGTVRVKVLIGKSGLAERYIITEAVDPLLDSAAAQAVMKASYSPASYHGQVLKSWMEVPIIFHTTNAKKPPVRFESDPEGDGYQHCQFDINRFYDSLNRKQMSFQKVPILKIDLVIDPSGKVLAVQCASSCAQEARAEVERVLQTMSITPGFRNGQAAIDHVRLVVNCEAFIPKPPPNDQR